MKKVGIVTFHNAINFGAVLQCYALLRKMRYFGFDAKVIDYRNKAIESSYSLLKVKMKHGIKKYIIEILKKIMFFKQNYSKKILFRNFLKDKCNLTREYKYEDLNQINEFDILITGSDQVWNKELTQGLDKVYMLDFDNKVQKYSYAASVGKDIISSAEANEIASYLKDFDGISVREETLQSALEKEGINDIKTVLDPVFLLDKKEWEELLGKRKIKEKYILVYNMEYNENAKNIVKIISEKTGFKIITFNKLSRYENVLVNKYVSGPIDFLNYIKYAELVITNSFHATAFSIIFEKQFYSIKHSEKNSRINEILTKFYLLDRLLVDEKDAKNIQLFDKIDYNKVKKYLNMERENSIEFLKKIGIDKNE